MDLLIAIIEFYNTYPHDDVFFSISEYLIEHFDEIEHESLSQMSEKMHVSISTLHRFLKKLFEVNYTEIRTMQLAVSDRYELEGKFYPEDSIKGSLSFEEYGELLNHKTKSLIDGITKQEVKEVTDLMLSAGTVIFGGYAMPYNTWRLQMALVLLHVRANVFLNPQWQQEQLESAEENDVLVIIRTISDSENFNYEMLKKAKEKNMKTVLIANNLSSSVMPYVDYPFVFSGTGTEIDSHMIHTILSLFGIVLNEELMNRRVEKIKRIK